MPAPRRLIRLPLTGSARTEAEMLEEIETHVALWVEYLTARGVSREEAQRRAQDRFGDFAAARVTLCHTAKQREGRMRRREWFGIVRQDVVFALRQARREIGTTAVIVATLGLGVGANIVMFGVVDRLLLSPPSNVPSADRVVRPWFERTVKQVGASATYNTNWPGYQRLAALHSFSTVAAYNFPSETPIGRGQDATSAIVGAASATLFRTLGAHPERGRFYVSDEDRAPAGSPVAVVSHDYYERHPDVLARKLTIESTAYTVVGVAPKGFTGATLEPVDIWIPITTWLHETYDADYTTDDGSDIFRTVARLRDGVTLPQATAEASTMYASRVDTSNTLRTPAPHVVLASIIPGRGADPHQTATVAAWLLGVAIIVLLIACANVATLLLIRAMRRRNEIALRLSLGISRRRLLAQLLVESAVIVGLATVAAVVVARLTHGLIFAVLLRGAASDAGTSTSHVVLLVVGIALVTTFLTALAPALHASSIDIASALKSSSTKSTLAASRVRPILAVTQVALSVVLLVGAGLFLRTLSNVRSIPLGLDADRLILALVQLPSGSGIVAPSATVRVSAGSPDAADEFWREAMRRVRSLPSVANATLSIGIPFRSSMGIGFRVPGHDSLPRLKSGGPYINAVSPSYFATLGTALVRGRVFTDQDRRDGARVAIINASLARLVWGRDNPIGACVKFGSDTLPCATVVGVVQDIHRHGVIEDAQLQYYVPLAQWPMPGFGSPAMIVRARTAGDVQHTIGDVRRALQSMSRDLSYPTIDSFADFLDPQLASWVLGARMFTLFGALAFMVAVIGLYGLLAHNVMQRRHELGIRAALGARSDDIVALVVRQGAGITVAGLVLGLIVAALLANRVAPLLFGVAPRDLATYGATALIAASIALAATLIPARRAAAIDPMEALRAE